MRLACPAMRFRDRDPVLRRPMGEHRPRRAVADRPDVLPARAAEPVHPDEPSFVPFDPRLLETEPFGGGPASDRDHHPFRLEPVRPARVLEMHGHRLVARLAAGDPLAQADVEALPAEDAERLLRDVPVRGGEKVVEGLQQHDLGAEPAPDAPELQADDPGSDDGEPPGGLVEGEGALGVHDARPVRRRRLDGGGDRAGSEDDVPGPEGSGRRARDLHRAVRGQPGRAGDELDAVLPEQAGDPAAEGGHQPVLARLHRGDVDPCALYRDAVFREEVGQAVEMVRRVEQGLRRDAPDVEAGPSEGGAPAGVGPLVDARGPEAELGAADGRDVAAGPRADHRHVERGRVVRGSLGGGGRAGGHGEAGLRVRLRGAGEPGLPRLP